MPRLTFEADDSANLLAEVRDFIDAIGEPIETGQPFELEVTGDVKVAGELDTSNEPDASTDFDTPADLGTSPVDIMGPATAIGDAPPNLAAGPPNPIEPGELPLGEAGLESAGTEFASAGAITDTGNVDVPTVELDKRGLPFDARIHSTNRTTKTGAKKADGTWRGKRGVAPELVAEVEVELRRTVGQVAAAQPAAAPIAKQPPVPDHPDTSLVGADVGATIALATQLVECVKDEAGLRAIGDEMRAVIAPFGMASINDLLSNADAAPAVHAGLLAVKAKWMPDRP